MAKRIKFDVQIAETKTEKEKTVTYGTRIPDTLNQRLLTIPKEDRAKLGLEFWTNVAKAYGV